MSWVYLDNGYWEIKIYRTVIVLGVLFMGSRVEGVGLVLSVFLVLILKSDLLGWVMNRCVGEIGICSLY